MGIIVSFLLIGGAYRAVSSDAFIYAFLLICAGYVFGYFLQPVIWALELFGVIELSQDSWLYFGGIDNPGEIAADCGPGHEGSWTGFFLFLLAIPLHIVLMGSAHIMAYFIFPVGAVWTLGATCAYAINREYKGTLLLALTIMGVGLLGLPWGGVAIRIMNALTQAACNA